MPSGKFAIATHALALLSQLEDGYPSEHVARSINTHPVFLRRVMKMLCVAGLVKAREGFGGGYRLTRHPAEISLSEVYAATEPSGPIPPSPSEPDDTCRIGGGMRAAFAEAARAANEGLLHGLATQTIADIAARAKLEGQKRPPSKQKSRRNPMASSKNVHEAGDINFDTEVLKADLPVLVDFTATWCGPCKAVAPIVDKIADENVGKYKVVKVDIDEAPSIAQRYGIRGVPTLAVFRGGEKKNQHVGATNKETLLRLLET
ncbi:MAG TPA: thioredoxin [Polyangiaceae bacterium]|nr:thioredoxin [Polyangiaceae bacterium]